MTNLIAIIPMIILVLIFIQGLLNAINPKIAWKIFESWKSTIEPPNSYFVSQRISGIISILIIIALFLFPYFISRQ